MRSIKLLEIWAPNEYLICIDIKELLLIFRYDSDIIFYF